MDVTRLKPSPAGFNQCPVCAYAQAGTAELCFSCSLTTTEPVPDPCCPTCSGPIVPIFGCENPVCNFDDRFYGRVWALAMRTGPMDQSIKTYKYGGKQTAWALIFARLLLGYLDANAAEISRFDMIVASPTFTGAGATRDWDHTGAIIEAAAREAAGRWPFDTRDPSAIIQIAATVRFVDKKSWKARRELAEGEFAASLSVPRPVKTRNKRILVFDDIYTDGLRLREVARALIERGGASEVSEIVLARSKFKQKGASQ